VAKRDDQSGLILLIEDNRGISETVGEFLERRGYSVDYAADGITGLHIAVTNSYDVIVLDLMLPGLDGIELCRKLRNEAKLATPVLMLTARDTVEDKLVGLDAGADDYLVKPFSLDELAARMRALLRRDVAREDNALRNGDLTLDPASRIVTRNDAVVDVSTREFALLAALLERPGTALSKSQLEERLYGWGEEVESNAVEVHVHNLRKKLGAEAIRTIRGVGYVIPRA
jgi:two-component system response regulator QseB